MICYAANMQLVGMIIGGILVIMPDHSIGKADVERWVVYLHCRHIVRPDVFPVAAINELPPTAIEPSPVIERTGVKDTPNELAVMGDVHKDRFVVPSSVLFVTEFDAGLIVVGAAPLVFKASWKAFASWMV